MKDSNITTFDKKDTLALKGLAIQVMVYLHCFANPEAPFDALYIEGIGGVFS